MGITLAPWTHSLIQNDALRLVDLAQPGLSISAWTAAAHDVLPQANPGQRNRLIAHVKALLDFDGGIIAASPFLALFHRGSPKARRELLWGRHALVKEWPLLAAHELILPHINRAEQPLAPRGAAIVPRDEWDALIASHVPPGTGAASRAKTRSALVACLAGLGSIEFTDPRHHQTAVRRVRPDPAAFVWLLWQQMRMDGVSESLDHWAVSASAPALLFAPPEHHAEYCLTVAGPGFFDRGFLAGAPRIRRIEPESQR